MGFSALPAGTGAKAMKHRLAKIGRFFWSWGFLKFVLWTITLIALFYAEEDWRGARDWANTKAYWEAKGESFDFNRLIPPPIPDDKNFAAIPLFKLEPDPETNGNLEPLALRRALRQNLPGSASALSGLGGGNKALLPDFEKMDRGIADAYGKAFKLPPTHDSLTQLEALYPCLADLRAVSDERPFCRFAQDYTSQPPYVRSFSLVVTQLALSRILALHAVAALHTHHPDLALADIEIMLKLSAGAGREPMLVSGLVGIGVTAITEQVIATGLSLHAWNDPQLVELQDLLRPFDYLTNYRLAMRGELAGFSLPYLDYIKKTRPNIFEFLYRFFCNSPLSKNSTLWNIILAPWPAGWIDQNKIRSADNLFTGFAYLDPSAHRCFPRESDQVLVQLRYSQQHWDSYAPWRIFPSVTLSPVLNAAVTFAQSQVKLDQARIACALERYRLAHGAYPSALDDLAPNYIAQVPQDVVNGEPYRYRLQPDGTFLLYSVGWNLKDDGGTTVTSLPASADPDDSHQKHGDWVWPVLRKAD